MDNPDNSLVADTSTGDNPTYLTVNDLKQQRVAMSSNPAYGAVFSGIQQPALQDNPGSSTISKSVSFTGYD